MAGLLHDLGKAVMPLDILNKTSKLTEEEFAIIRSHPERGWRMLQEGRGASDAAMDVCLHHHERMDGRGYPHSLPGAQLSTLARMGAVCDVYDAITSNRPYKVGWDPSQSLSRMASWKNAQRTSSHPASSGSGLTPTPHPPTPALPITRRVCGPIPRRRLEAEQWPVRRRASPSMAGSFSTNLKA